MERKNYDFNGLKHLVLFLLIFFAGKTDAQVRYSNLSLNILYPEVGHYFISPGTDSVVFTIYNNGPDTIFSSDRFSVRILLSDIYLDPLTSRNFGENLLPGDSINQSIFFPLKYYHHRTEIPICLSLKSWSMTNSILFSEEDSTSMFENNVTCKTVAHNRLVGIENAVTDPDITLYPNPASDKLLLKGIIRNQVLSVEVYDNLGNNIIIGSLNENAELDVSELAVGVYFAKISLNSKVISKRFLLVR
jgi:hypothetical protein